jgi:hypothetical protein
MRLGSLVQERRQKEGRSARGIHVGQQTLFSQKALERASPTPQRDGYVSLGLPARVMALLLLYLGSQFGTFLLLITFSVFYVCSE